jgi:hypothetical protein
MIARSHQCSRGSLTTLPTDICFVAVGSKSQGHPDLWATQDVPFGKPIFVLISITFPEKSRSEMIQVFKNSLKDLKKGYHEHG